MSVVRVFMLLSLLLCVTVRVCVGVCRCLYVVVVWVGVCIFMLVNLSAADLSSSFFFP